MFKKLFNRKQKKEQGMPFTWYHNIFESVVHMTPEERDVKYDLVWKRDFALGWKPFREMQEVAAYKGAFLGLALLESIWKRAIVCKPLRDVLKQHTATYLHINIVSTETISQTGFGSMQGHLRFSIW